MRRSDLETKQRRRKRTLLKISGWISFIVIVVLFVYHMNQPYFFVSEISLKGNKTLLSTNIKEVTESHMKKMWLGVIPKRNVFFYSPGKLTKTLLQEFPKIYHVDFDVDVTTLNIRIEEREAHSLWCIDREYESMFDEECYFADQRGFWYDRAPYFSDHILPKVYIAPEVDSIRIQEQAMPESEFLKLFSFVKAIEDDYDIKLARMSILRKGDITFDIRQYQDKNLPNEPRLLINTKDEFDLIHRNLGIILTQQDFIRDFERIPDRLETIDLRFDGRIFYRFIPED